MILDSGFATSILDAKRQPIADVRRVLDVRNAKAAAALMDAKGASALTEQPALARIFLRMGRAVHGDHLKPEELGLVAPAEGGGDGG